jgi:hypothetical protein
MLRLFPHSRRAFSTLKEEYSRHFIVKIRFHPDGYYESSKPTAT